MKEKERERRKEKSFSLRWECKKERKIEGREVRLNSCRGKLVFANREFLSKERNWT